MCNNNENSNCIAEILKVICVLQQNAECNDACLDTCDRGFLGCGVSSLNCNTRPIVLYTCGSNGIPFRMPVTKDNIICDETTETCSNVFRVEKIDGCCATFRVLEPNPNTEEAGIFPYVATNSFFTIDCGCLCAIRCLTDTFVDCVC